VKILKKNEEAEDDITFSHALKDVQSTCSLFTQNRKFYLLTYGCKLFTHTHKTSDKYMGTKSVPYYFNVAPGKRVLVLSCECGNKP